MLFVRDAYRGIVRVVIFQSCRAFVTDFLKGHRLASPKAAHQVHTTEQADEDAVQTNLDPHVPLHRIVMALLTGIELLPAETKLDCMLGPEGKA